jgi:hypothetical protein
MGAPTVTARVDPPGIKLDDGHSTTFAFSADANVNLWEKTVTPPGIDGGDEIDTTTMHNNTWRTRAPRQLKTLTEMSCTCAYDPVVYTELLALINVRQSITVHGSFLRLPEELRAGGEQRRRAAHGRRDDRAYQRGP